MATANEKAHWNDEEIAHFLNYLEAHKSEIGDAGSFKASTFNAVATHIAPYLSQGPVKTSKMCKTKWQSVCGYFINPPHFAY
jgi:hypothetical protein